MEFKLSFRMEADKVFEGVKFTKRHYQLSFFSGKCIRLRLELLNFGITKVWVNLFMVLDWTN